MNSQKVSPTQKIVGLTLLSWLVFTTWQLAPYNPPEWSKDFLTTTLWYALVFYFLLILSMAPIGFVIIVAYKLIGFNGMIFCSFWFMYLLDKHMEQYYPVLHIAPGCALSALYMYETLKWIKKP